MAPTATANRGASEIESRWQVPLGLAPDDPADPGTEWRGPCPKCKTRGAFTATPGHTRPVVCCLHCDCDPADVHVILKRLIPGAPRPGKAKHPALAGRPRATKPDAPGELAALRAAVEALARNDRFTRSAPIRLALLEVLGQDTAAALDALGIADATTRRRTVAARSQALAPKRRRPAKTGVNASKPTSKARLPLPAETGVNAFPLQLTERPSTCGNVELTDRSTIVLGPTGSTLHTRNTDTGTQALDLLRDVLGAQLIRTEPRPSPLPVADVVDAWQLAAEGPCHRCRTRTCVYGLHGNPLCVDCRAA